ncbi:PASTA domain-containing protein [bacterium]|nr:PASTA domain-containing protein [bacterium]
MSKKPWLRRLLFAFALIAALALGFVILDFGLRRWVRSEGAFSVPDLVGLSREEAYQTAARRSLLLEEGPAEFDAWLPAGFVLRQRPRSPETIKEGRRVKIVLSAGPQLAAIPDLRGASERQARLQLEDLGLTAGHWTSVTGAEAAGRVLATRPAAGTRVPRGGRVDLLISQGPAGPGYLLPDFSRLELEQVLSMLQKAGLGRPRIRYDEMAGRRAGEILNQSLPAGSRLSKGDDLELVVASGS